MTFEESQPSLQPPCDATFPNASAEPRTEADPCSPLLAARAHASLEPHDILARDHAGPATILRHDGQTRLVNRGQRADKSHRFLSAGTNSNSSARAGKRWFIRMEDACKTRNDEPAGHRSSRFGHYVH